MYCYNYAFWKNLFEICFKGISKVSNGATKVAKVWHLKCSWIGWGHDIFVRCTQKKRNPKPNNYWTTACWLFRSSQYFFLSNPLLRMLGKLTKIYLTLIVRVKFLYFLTRPYCIDTLLFYLVAAILAIGSSKSTSTSSATISKVNAINMQWV